MAFQLPNAVIKIEDILFNSAKTSKFSLKIFFSQWRTELIFIMFSGIHLTVEFCRNQIATRYLQLSKILCILICMCMGVCVWVPTLTFTPSWSSLIACWTWKGSSFIMWKTDSKSLLPLSFWIQASPPLKFPKIVKYMTNFLKKNLLSVSMIGALQCIC